MSVTIELWNDTGYTESGVERPPIGATLSNPDYIYYNLNPQRSDLFSTVQIRAPYTDLYKVSYLRATYDFNESEPLVLYGWVDSVALVSDTDSFPSTQVDWHVDLWRTYASNTVFRAGTVHRRPLTANVPPQPYPFRYKTVTSRQTLVPNAPGFGGESIWWVYMNFIQEFDEAQTTEIRHICWPVLSGGGAAYTAVGEGAQTHQGPTFNDVFAGKVDEVLKLSPSAIIACTISPISPIAYTGNGYMSTSPIVMENGTWGLMQVGDSYVFEVSRVPTVSNFFQEFTATLPQTVKTDDVDEYLVTGVDGATIGTLPWGLAVKDYTYRMIDDTSSFYIQVRFDGVDSMPEGLAFTQPLPLLAVTQNSWSDYVYSGQREYDIRTRQLQTAQEVISGLTGAVTTGINAWQMESLANMNKRKPEFTTNPKTGLVINNPKGVAYNAKLARMAGMTGAAAMGAVVASTAVQGLVNTYFNSEYQKWEDYAHAHQIDNIVTSGAGTDNIFYGRPIGLVCMRSDDYSVQQRNTDISMYGAHVTEPLSSCQSIVEAGGPLQITNMTVGGDIPVEAKEYIRAMFSNGVRLV